MARIGTLPKLNRKQHDHGRAPGMRYKPKRSDEQRKKRTKFIMNTEDLICIPD